MSRDGWMKKKANAGDDNGWASRVSTRRVSPIPVQSLYCTTMTGQCNCDSM